MNYAVSSIFEGMKPQNNQKLREYIEQAKEQSKPKDYYVEYDVKYLETAKINCYMENRINYIVIEYSIPDDSMKDGKRLEKLIIAKNPNKMGSFAEIKQILESFIKSVQKYATEGSIHPEAYVAKLRILGWNFTPEGLDFMQTTKQDNVKLIRKTEFREEESESLTKEELKENRDRHFKEREEELIKILEDYLIQSYTNLPENISEDLKAHKGKVLKYAANKKDGVKESSTDVLDSIFREMKPIEEETTINKFMQQTLNHNLKKYMDMIPEGAREKNIHKILESYINVREQAIEERKDGKLLPNSGSKNRLKFIIKSFDIQKEENAKAARDLLNSAIVTGLDKESDSPEL